MELFATVGKLIKFAIKAILTFYLCCFWIMFCMKLTIVLNEIYIEPVERKDAVAITPKVVSSPKIDSREKSTWTRDTHWEQTRQDGPDKAKFKENSAQENQTPRESQIVSESPRSRASDYDGYNRLSRNDDDMNPAKNASVNTTPHNNNSNYRNIDGERRYHWMCGNETQRASVIPTKSLHLKCCNGSRLSQTHAELGILGVDSMHRMSPDDLKPQLLDKEIPLIRALSLSDKRTQGVSAKDTIKITLVFDKDALVIVDTDHDQTQRASIIVSKTQVDTWIQTALTDSKRTHGKSEVEKSKTALKTVFTLVAETFRFSEVDRIQRSSMDLTRDLTIRQEHIFPQTTQNLGKEALLRESIGERVSRPTFTRSDLAQYGLSMNRLTSFGSLIYGMSSLGNSSPNSNSSLDFPKSDGKSSQENQGPKAFPDEAEKLITNRTHGNPSSVFLSGSVGACVDVTPWTILFLLPFVL